MPEPDPLPITTLGRTGLRVSRLGLGGGGPSRLGLRDGRLDTDAARDLVRHAINLGITLIDTAESYGTEPVIGDAVASLGLDAGRTRDELVICTKASVRDHAGGGDAAWRSPEAFAHAIEQSLARLRTDRIDVFQVHAASLEDEPRIREAYLPMLERARDRGLIRFIGITEAFATDPAHAMLAATLGHGCWDTAMVGFNALNQSARHAVVPDATAHNVGTLAMFAVRRALSDPDRLREVLDELIERGEVHPGSIDRVEPLGFFREAGEGPTPVARMVDAAYRFCRDEPGIDVVLSGTGDPAHLEANAASFRRPPLPDFVTDRLRAVLGHVRSVSGN